MADNKVKVKIYGQEYTISGERDEQTIIEIAEYVDTKMREISRFFSSRPRRNRASRRIRVIRPAAAVKKGSFLGCNRYFINVPSWEFEKLCGYLVRAALASSSSTR